MQAVSVTKSIAQVSIDETLYPDNGRTLISEPKRGVTGNKHGVYHRNLQVTGQESLRYKHS